MSKQLLIEVSSGSYLPIVEDKSTGKLVIRGQVGVTDSPTANGRVYPRKIVESAISRLGDSMKNRQLYGELDHPSDGKTKLQRVSHLITGLHVEDDGTVTGEFEILNTPNGKIIKSIKEQGGRVGVSSRGFGSAAKKTPQGHDEIGEDYVLKAYDVVADPADRDAYPEFFNEDKELDLEKAWDEMDEDSLRETFPHLVESVESKALAKIAKKATKGVNLSVDEAVNARVEVLKAEMQEAYERQVVDGMVDLKEEIETAIREEFESDPQIGGAREVLERVSDMVHVFGREPDTQALHDKITALESEKDGIAEERNELAVALKNVGYKLYLEQDLRNHPLRETVMNVMGDLSGIKNIKELGKRLEIVKGEMDDIETVVEDNASGYRDELVEELKRDRENLKSRLVKAVEIGEKLNDQNSDLIEKLDGLAEELNEANDNLKDAELDAYRFEKSRGSTNQPKLDELTENAGSKDEVDRIVREMSSRKMTDPTMETVRQRIKSRGRGDRVEPVYGNGQGSEPNLAREVFEDTGFDVLANFDKLAGLNSVDDAKGENN